jgi:hypothetical protein
MYVIDPQPVGSLVTAAKQAQEQEPVCAVGLGL